MSKTLKTGYADRETEKQLKALEERIAEVYRQAAEEETETIKKFYDSFAKEDAKKKAQVEKGKLTEEKYQRWRLEELRDGKRYEAMRDKLADRMTRANEVAIAYVNDSTPGIYSLNRNWTAYTIEQAAGNCDFTLFDEQTVKRLIKENPSLMPNYPEEKAVKRGIDLEYGKKQITASVTSSILQGKSIPSIAEDLQKRITDMSTTSAVRTARTATTGAQNAGRIDGYEAASKRGIKLKKQWLATLDGRTRHSHAMLDGETQDTDKKFSNGCMFPGDPNGRAEEVYNCRCTLIASIDGEKYEDAQRRARDPTTGKNAVIADMTYAEWAGWKTAVAKQEVKPPERHRTWVSDALDNLKVEYNQVLKRENELTEDEIINELSGGDLTGGSCASVALAYIGQKYGYDVHDFRGGQSQEWFSRKSNKVDMFESLGATVMEESKFKTTVPNAKKILKNCEKGREYYLQAGGHAAIVRLNDDNKLQFLELQSRYQNGWKNFEEEYYSLDERLKDRFGCSTTSKYISTVYMTDIGQLKDNDEFIDILGYINTSADKQKKGNNGGIK